MVPIVYLTDRGDTLLYDPKRQCASTLGVPRRRLGQPRPPTQAAQGVRQHRKCATHDNIITRTLLKLEMLVPSVTAPNDEILHSFMPDTSI